LKEIKWNDKNIDLYKKVPSFENGDLTLFTSYFLQNSEFPSFIRYFVKEPVMVFHHLFGGLYGVIVVPHLRGKIGDCIISIIFLMEISTPFVNLRAILSTLKHKDTKFYLWNGILMVVTFFVFRIILLPGMLVMYSNIINKSFFRMWFDLPIICQSSIMILFILQFYWFYLMIKGALSLLNKSKSKIYEKERKTPAIKIQDEHGTLK
jgi:hypothetical protein